MLVVVERIAHDKMIRHFKANICSTSEHREMRRPNWKDKAEKDRRMRTVRAIVVGARRALHKETASNEDEDERGIIDKHSK